MKVVITPKPKPPSEEKTRETKEIQTELHPNTDKPNQTIRLPNQTIRFSDDEDRLPDIRISDFSLFEPLQEG